MKRFAVICGVLLALAASVPAHAHVITGTVRLAAASPTVPRTMYMMSRGSNGMTGYVFPLHAGADGKTYTLTRTGGATGIENLDAYFYTDLAGTGTPCAVVSNERGDTETGTISCPAGLRPAWGVIVLRGGANATFSFAY